MVNEPSVFELLRFDCISKLELFKFQKYGKELTSPIKDLSVNVRMFPLDTFIA